MVSHTIMTIIQCMIMAYMLTTGQVQTLQPVDASLSKATCDDDVLTKSIFTFNPITACIMATSFLNAWLAGTMTHCNRSILLLLSLVSMSRAVHTFYKKLIYKKLVLGQPNS